MAKVTSIDLVVWRAMGVTRASTKDLLDPDVNLADALVAASAPLFNLLWTGLFPVGPIQDLV